MAFSNEQFQLKNRVAIVTGAGGRGNSIGRAYALGLAQAGANVVVADLNEAGANAVADEINTNGGKAIATRVDIGDSESTQCMVEQTVNTFGGVDILVNNAALMVELGPDQAVDIDITQWTKIIDINLTGALRCVQAAVPEMRKRGGGRIINQVSGGAFPAGSVYGIGKLALHGLTTTLARQLGRDKITVNSIAPGNVRSDAGKELVPDDSPFLQFLNMTVAMRAQGDPDELVGPLLMLCSPAGEWVTGQVVHVDGGWVMTP